MFTLVFVDTTNTSNSKNIMAEPTFLYQKHIKFRDLNVNFQR